MHIENLFKVISAAHISHMVDSPNLERGGLLLIAGPGNLKSTIVDKSIHPFTDKLSYSDLTLKQLAVVRNGIANGLYHTLGFLEMEKLYARHQAVAMNLEGVIKGMTCEGFTHFAFEDKRCWVPRARCFVLASVLHNLYQFHFPRWTENGFLRRFIQVKYSLSMKSKQKMMDAMHRGEEVKLPDVLMVVPSTKLKPDVTVEESKKIATILQGDDEIYTPLNIMRRVLVILKWRHKADKQRRTQPTPMEIIQDLSYSIGSPGLGGGTLEL